MLAVNQAYHLLFARSEIDRSRMLIHGILMASLLCNSFFVMENNLFVDSSLIEELYHHFQMSFNHDFPRPAKLFLVGDV